MSRGGMIGDFLLVIEDVVQPHALSIVNRKSSIVALRCRGLDTGERGAGCVVLGCTDLPVILAQADVPYPLVASNDVLAEVLFSFAVD